VPRFTLDVDEWQIEQDGARLLLTAGGKENVRKFVSPDHAAVQYGKLIAAKQAEGWALAAAASKKAVTAKAEPIEPDLEKAIVANPYDRDAYAVYGDWYQAQNHPRGELIALQLADDDDRKIAEATKRHLARHKAQLLGPLEKYEGLGTESPLRWHCGFIHAIDLNLEGESVDLGKLVREVVAHSSGRFLADVTIRDVRQDAIEGVLAALRPETLYSLKIVTTARLERIDVIAKAPLRRLVLKLHDGPSNEALETLTRIRPTIKDLHLRLEATRDQWPALAPLFARADLGIKKLAIRTPHLVDQILAGLGQQPMSRSLERLDFALTDPETGVRDLIAQREAFPKLIELVFGGNRVIARAVAELKKLVKKVVDVRQDSDDRILMLDDDQDYYDVQE